MSHHKYKLVQVPMIKLFVDGNVQREMNKQNVNDLASQWEWDSCLPLVGSKRSDGTTHLVDGQHRYLALVELGYTGSVPVLVYEGLSLDQEAALFLSYNNTKRVPLVDKYLVRLKANDGTTLTIQAVLDKLDLFVARNHTPRAVCSVKSLYDVNRAYGPKVLERALIIIETCFGDTGTFQGPLIEAISSIIAGAGKNLDESRLINTLSRYPYRDDINLGDSWYKMSLAGFASNSSTRWRELKRIIIQKYNNRLSESQKI